MQPHDILPDHQNDVQVNGLTVRKGSVGAFLAASVTGRIPPAMLPPVPLRKPTCVRCCRACTRWACSRC